MRRSICWAWRKSSKVNWPLRMRSSISACSSSETACSARSIRLSTSPMPRMREAIRSGWKTSSASSFSPVETNMIGRPVTSLTESAAPPRASPSSLVRMTPSKAIRSWKAAATVGGLLAGHRVEHEQRRRSAAVASRDPLELVHQLVVDLEAAGGVDDHGVEALGPGALEAAARRLDRVGGVGAEDGDVDLGAELLELVDRGRALRGRRRRAPGLRPCARRAERQLGRGRRLARALEPREQDHRAAAELELDRARRPELGQLVVDDLHDLLARGQALQHLLAERALAHPLDEARRRPRG